MGDTDGDADGEDPSDSMGLVSALSVREELKRRVSQKATYVVRDKAPVYPKHGRPKHMFVTFGIGSRKRNMGTFGTSVDMVLEPLLVWMYDSPTISMVLHFCVWCRLPQTFYPSLCRNEWILYLFLTWRMFGEALLAD